MKIAVSQAPGVLLKLPLMHQQQLKKKAQRLHSSSLTNRSFQRSTSYLKTRIRGSRLQNAARILVLVELIQRLHQAYRFAYDKQASDRLLPQNTQPRQEITVCQKFYLRVQGLRTRPRH